MTEEKRKLYMWVSVIVVTLIIGFVWVASVKYSITTSIIGLKETKDAGTESFGKLLQDFEKPLQEVKDLFNATPTTPTIEIVTSTIGSATSTK